MPLLTKKFTRDSLKRASGGGGASFPNESEDLSKSEMIRMEMVRARSKSMRSRNALHQQQRRHRSLSKRPSSPYGSNAQVKTNSGEPKGPYLSHPNDEYNQAYNEAELLTQMSSLTEPTWAPSVVGGSDINSAHHRHNHHNRSRTSNYNNVRQPSRFQRSSINNRRENQTRATITISTAKDQKETKVLLLNERRNEEGNEDSNKSNSNHGHHERAFVGTEGIELHQTRRKEGREDEGDMKTTVSSTECLQTSSTTSDLRDDVEGDDAVPLTPGTKDSSSRPRSKTRRQKINSSRTRGRSGRPSSHRRSKNRSSLDSSQRTARTMSTAPTVATISKQSSTSSSLSVSIASRKSRRETTDTVTKEKPSTIGRSSSVPPSTTNSKRSQRTSSVPPPIIKKGEMQMLRHNVRKTGRDDDDSASIRIKKTNLESIKNLTNKITESTSADATTPSLQLESQATVSFGTESRAPEISPVNCTSPTSARQAARLSLLPRLRRSNSSRSLSSGHLESNISTTSNIRRKISTEDAPRKAKVIPPVTPTSPSKNSSASRIHKLTHDIRAKRIHEQRQQRRQELEMEQKRRQEQNKESPRETEARVDDPRIEDEEPHYTTTFTLLFDFAVYCLLSLLTLPQCALFYLWSRVFSKKWTARRKNILLTGANTALGSEIARQLAMEGANLILVSHSQISCESDLNGLVEHCLELGSGKTRSYSADLSSAVSTELTLRQAATDFDHKFDVVVLNGEQRCHGCLFEEIVDVHQIEKMVMENILGCIQPLHHSLKHIPKTSDSRIVILSSTLGMVASPFRSVYCATQHALKGFCDSIRMELKDTYTERRAPKICFASFPELRNINHRDKYHPLMSMMGAEIAPMKTRSWAAAPIQQAVHGLLEVISSGQRDFGVPNYVNAWKFFQVLAPDIVDFSVFRHFRKTLYRPKVGSEVSVGRKGGKCDGASVSNKTWSQ